jgi:hypothetical protein
MVTRELIQKFRNGDGHLSDTELDELIEHYKQLDELLDVHGCEYGLFANDILYCLRLLNQYKSNRDIKNTLTFL